MKLRRILSAAAAVAAALTLTACQGGEEADASQPQTPAGVAVQVTQVTRDTIATENRVSGAVAADSQESVFVSANAQVTAVYVETGDEVSAGDWICTLDMDSTISSYNAANITYQSSVQSYADQQAIFDRQIALAEKNVDRKSTL